jgi:hypothetical protein
MRVRPKQTKKHEIIDGVFPKKGLYLSRFGGKYPNGLRFRDYAEIFQCAPYRFIM